MIIPAISFRRLLFRVRVSGESMWPALIPGSTYFACGILPVRIGDLVVFRNPEFPSEIYVKRVTAVRDAGFVVDSSVSWGSSSRELGLINKKYILGKIICPVIPLWLDSLKANLQKSIKWHFRVK